MSGDWRIDGKLGHLSGGEVAVDAQVGGEVDGAVDNLVVYTRCMQQWWIERGRREDHVISGGGGGGGILLQPLYVNPMTWNLELFIQL